MQIVDLNRLYEDSDQRTRELFAEMRSNILLVNGNHYARRNSKFIKNIRGQENLTSSQKLRLTKNHVQKIVKAYINNILSLAPGTTLKPRNPSEMQDIKATELNLSVWEDTVRQHKLKILTRNLIKDYVEIGEFWVKVFYDEFGGKFLGYRNEFSMDEVTGEELEVRVKKFLGALVYERYQGFNVLVDSDARSYEEAGHVIFRKMLPIKDLKYKYKDDEEKLSYIGKSSKETYKVFDGLSGQYSDVKGLAMVREYFFRPTPETPEGYFYIATEQGILHEGSLPFGLWPVVHKGFDEVSTTARSYSVIKPIRPYQGEVNRTASKIAETQITLGDDKIITAPGASMSPGATHHGLRHVKVTGAIMQVVPGRTGEQYLQYLTSQIEEMYRISNVQEDNEKSQNQQDPYGQLFRTMREKKNYIIYSDKVSEGLQELTELSLELRRKYIKDEELIPIVGKNEFVNIAEFKSTEPFRYRCLVEEQSDDVETKTGRLLGMNHIMQYVGPNMKPEDIGILIKHMPYMNSIKSFEKFTMNEDIVEAIILALDRGEYPKLRERSPHDYIVQRLEFRMSKNDFDFLPDEVKKNYEKKLKEHEEIIVKQKQEAQMAEQGNIPSGGYLVTCDFYVPNPAGPDKPPKRLRLPYQTLEYVLKKLESQGQAQERMQAEPMSVQADIGKMMAEQNKGQQSGGGDVPSQATVTQSAMQ